MSKEHCNKVKALLNSGYYDKVTENLKKQYDAISSRGIIRDAKLVKHGLSAIAYTGFAILSGCRPESCLKIKGKDLELIISDHPRDVNKKLAAYIDPQLLVKFAHDHGYHRFSLSAGKAVIKLDGADHPWLSDSDEDDDDYKKAEDDWVSSRSRKRGREEEEGDY